MSTDFRALCAELTQQLDDALDFTVSSETRLYMKALVVRARAALAEPVPEDDVALLREALAATAAQRRAEDDARAALAADGPAVPEGHQPAPPAAGEVGKLVTLLRYEAREADLDLMTAEECHRAAELLEQRHPEPVRLQQLETLAADAVSALRYIEQHHGRLYGVGWDRVFSEAAKLQPAPIPALPEDVTVIEPSERTILVPHQAPVPVAERPWEREGWCDEEGRCWCFFDNSSERGWQYRRPQPSFYDTHCLPHYALPLPMGEVEQ